MTTTMTPAQRAEIRTRFLAPAQAAYAALDAHDATGRPVVSLLAPRDDAFDAAVAAQAAWDQERATLAGVAEVLACFAGRGPAHVVLLQPSDVARTLDEWAPRLSAAVVERTRAIVRATLRA